MRAEYETFQDPPRNRVMEDVPRSTNDLSEVKESLEQTRSDVRRTRTEITRYRDDVASYERRVTALWAVAVLLVISVALMAWYGIPLMKEHKAFLTQIPGMQTAVDSIGTRMASVESKLNSWADDQVTVSDRLANIEKSVKANLGVAQSGAQALARGIRTEIGQSIQAIQSRLSGVESKQQNASEQMARMQNELVTVQGQLADLRQENAEKMSQVQQQIQETQQSTQRDMSGLDRRLVSNQNQINGLSYQTDRQRVDFELAKGRTEEVSPNIFLTIKDIDVEHQRVNGWLQIANDGRIVWLRDQGMQNPVPFSSRQDQRSYQLVFTQTAKTAVSGYLLVPTTPTSNAAARE